MARANLGIKNMNRDIQELEPEAERLLKSGLEINLSPALYSIAISLKRIADALTNKDYIKKFGK